MAEENGSAAQNQAIVAAVRPWQDVITAGGIVLSAGTYLFDFISNVVVLVEYSMRYTKLLHYEEQGSPSCDARCHVQTSKLAGYFYGLLATLACCHSLNALLFKLKFTHNEAPLCAAYFLPLIHLYRLCNLLWRTLSCKGVQDVKHSEMNGLYSILGSAMEGAPMLILQFCAYLDLARAGIFLHMSTTFKVSIAASLIAAAYNGGTSVQSIAKNATTTFKKRLGAAVIGGSFTLNAMVVRGLTFTYIIVHIHSHFLGLRTERQRAKFHTADSLSLVVVGGSVVAYTLYFWLLHSPRAVAASLRNPRRLLTALVFSYMSMYLGPLYPLISQANDLGELGGHRFRWKLCGVSLLHLLLDLTVLIVANMLVSIPTQYLIASSLAAGGYLVSLLAYMKLDKACGPTRDSIASISAQQQQQYQYYDDNDTNKHDKLMPMDGHTIYPQVLMMSKEADAFLTLSFRSTHTLASGEDEESMASSPLNQRPSPSEKHCVYAPPADPLKPNAHLPQRAQLPYTWPLKASSLSLDRGKGLAMVRHLNPSLATNWASFHRGSSSYSEGSTRTRSSFHCSTVPVRSKSRSILDA